MQLTSSMPYGPHPSESSGKRRREPADKARRVQVTIDLTQDEYQLLNLWLARASVELDQPISSMTLSRGMKALIRAAAADRVVNDIVLDVLRKDQT
jgi:hypothetical protein